MDLELIKDIYNLHIRGFEGLGFDVICKENYEITYNKSIAWQIYNDFSKLNDINTNCKFNVKLEVVKDMNEFADYVISCYKTDEEDDPYGELDEGYSLCYKNYKQVYDDIESEFYYIKVDDKIVGTTQSVYNNKICGIYSLALKKNIEINV